MQRAEDEGAEAVLLSMDTPGGLGSSMDQITESFLASKIPVIAYVSPSGARAASAGAFILLSAPVAAMAPGTRVGASTPIGLSGGDLDQKVKNDATRQIEGLATTYGRNADVAATFVTQAASITAEQALDDGVIDLIAPSTQELLDDAERDVRAARRRLDRHAAHGGRGRCRTRRWAGSSGSCTRSSTRTWRSSSSGSAWR